MCDEDSDSSFYDDAVYESEEEFFSSDYEEGDTRGYLAPPSRNKEHYAYLLDIYSPTDNDDDRMLEFKEYHIRNIMNKWENFINKRRNWYAYNRLKKVMHTSYDPKVDAFILEKQELINKKLQKMYYYEPVEPFTYKKLLKKRRNAIKRKYQMYAFDNDWRTQYQNQILDGGLRCKMKKCPPFYQEMASYDDKFGNVTEWENEEEKPDESEVSSLSSFYDDEIPLSEREFIEENFTIELPCPHPGPISRTFGKYKRLKAKATELEDDDPWTRDKKRLRRAEISAYWANFLEKRRAIKAISRLQAAEAQEFEDIIDEAEFLNENELLDKKLDRGFYYDPNADPGPYSKLLELRTNAIFKKFEQYAYDEDFRNEYKHRIYVQFLRIRDSPLFEKPLEEVDSFSSINDSEIPTSEDEFMSRTEICIPEENIDRPPTRVREAFYKELDRYEPDDGDSENTMFIKRLLRYVLLIQYKGYLIHRRQEKAKRRMEIVQDMGYEDPGTMAFKLRELELQDKHLDKPYLYFPGEDCIYTQIRNKRVRAIERKFDRYIEDKNFRAEYEERVLQEAKEKLRSGLG